jgi:hypothetical protein
MVKDTEKGLTESATVADLKASPPMATKDTEKGLTGAQFAKEIGKDAATVSRWKSGKIKTPEAIAAQWEYRESDQRWHQKHP